MIFKEVPFRASDFSTKIFLPPSITTCVPTTPSLVFNSHLETEAIEGSASPRNPKVSIKNKSSSLYILLVACL